VTDPVFYDFAGFETTLFVAEGSVTCYQGQPVAMVLADSRKEAEAAASVLYASIEYSAPPARGCSMSPAVGGADMFKVGDSMAEENDGLTNSLFDPTSKLMCIQAGTFTDGPKLTSGEDCSLDAAIWDTCATIAEVSLSGTP
jgi:hypothetical protein